MMIRVCVIYIFVLRPTTATPWPFVSCLQCTRVKIYATGRICSAGACLRVL